MRRIVWLVIALFWLIPIQAQDGLNLPTELYILLNEGVVERYGLGVAGVQRVSPSDEFVVDFRVAPDGMWLAYRTQTGLYITDMFSEGSTRQIENERASIPTIRGRGDTIAWTPNSDAIAYTTEYGGRVHFLGDGSFVDMTTPGLLNLVWSPDGSLLAGEAPDGVWWLFLRLNNTITLRSAIAGSNGGAWLNNSQFIYGAPEGGLIALDVNSGQQTTLLPADASYRQPIVLSDGRIRVFRGDQTQARLLEVTIASGSPDVTEIGTGDVDLTLVRWAPGGYLLTAFQSGVLAIIEPISGSGFTLPITSASTYGWGPEYPPITSGINISSEAYFLAADNAGIQQVWRLSGDGSVPVAITPATQDISEFAFSLDGERIAYVSNSGLWVFNVDGSEAPRELVQLGMGFAVTPAWAPDNETIYYHDEQGGVRGIWRVSDTVAANNVLTDTDSISYTNPQPANGIGAMLVNQGEELVLVDTTSLAITPIGAVGQATWSVGTRYFVQGENRNGSLAGRGLFQFDAVDPTAVSLILPTIGALELLDYRELPSGSIRMLIRNTRPGIVQVLELPSGGGSPIFIGSAGYLANPRLSPDGSLIIGQTYPGGALIIVEIAGNQATLIDTLPQVRGFRWR